MESNGGSGLPPSYAEKAAAYDRWYAHFHPIPPDVNGDEMAAIALGEPYCFLCGKPASTFSIYDDLTDPRWDKPTRAQAVESEEGTYNPATNRFACDECYIRIGQPSGPNGWKAP